MAAALPAIKPVFQAGGRDGTKARIRQSSTFGIFKIFFQKTHTVVYTSHCRFLPQEKSAASMLGMAWGPRPPRLGRQWILRPGESLKRLRSRCRSPWETRSVNIGTVYYDYKTNAPQFARENTHIATNFANSVSSLGPWFSIWFSLVTNIVEFEYRKHITLPFIFFSFASAVSWCSHLGLWVYCSLEPVTPRLCL